MLTNKKTGLIAVSCLAFALVAGVAMKAFAETDTPAMQNPSHEQLAQRIADKLGLDDKAEKQVSALFEEDSKKIRAIQKELHKTQVALSQLNPAKEDYLKKVENLAEKSAEQTKALTLAYAENRASLYKLLTPKQIETLETPVEPAKNG